MADPRQDGTADLAIVNARAWTVSGDLPTAEAVAVRGDRIVAVGSDDYRSNSPECVILASLHWSTVIPAPIAIVPNPRTGLGA